jgi:hypothetical protein
MFYKRTCLAIALIDRPYWNALQPWTVQGSDELRLGRLS